MTALILITAIQLRADLHDSLQTILSVSKEGRGNEKASAAWQAITQGNADHILPILEAMDGASELSINWLRSAVEVLADKRSSESSRLPMADLGAFLLNTRHHPKARALAFELIQQNDATAAEKLVPGLINDPSNTLRRLAVQRLLDQADALKESSPTSATLLYQQALNAARDPDQVDILAAALRQQGRTVDLPTHFGFVTAWQVIGPFHNIDRKGFEAIFPPETEIDLEATYQGKNGAVQWKPHGTDDAYGMVDLNEPLGHLKEVTGYAYTVFHSSSTQPAEIRLGCKNAWKIWLNGEFVFGREEYHRGMRMDQYRMPIQLREGPNPLLVKLCQNEQVEDWTKEWQFQLRICDSTGTAILATDRLAHQPPSPRRDPVQTASR